MRTSAALTGILLCVNATLAQTETRVEPVDLGKFSKGGVIFEKRIRLRVRDIRVGAANASHLFESVDNNSKASSLDRLLGLNHEVRLTLKQEYSQEDLRDLFLQEYVDALTVQLVDEEDILLKQYIPESRFRRTLVIPVILSKTPCEEVTQIIYEEIDEHLKTVSIRDGETTAQISLNDVFTMLLDDRIGPFLGTLDLTRKDHPCLKDFELLKWLRGEEVYGFAREEYRIHTGLLDLLGPTLKAIKQVRADWQEFNFEIKCVGYSDSVPVKGISLDRKKTGVKGWGASVPFDVRYQGCRGDRVLQKDPLYIDYDFPVGDKIAFIRSNCELGAVRSYVVATYLLLELGPDRTEFRYATGGVMSGHLNDNLNRRVEIEVILKAARE